MKKNQLIYAIGLLTSVYAVGCTWEDGSQAKHSSPAAGVRLENTSCQSLEDFSYANTQITSVKLAEAGDLKIGGNAIGAHCVVEGKMFERVSPVDGQTYAIGFEMRLPLDWNGRFFYQANGGLDGRIVTAQGSISGGGPVTNALYKGFAVISSDAGHSSAQNGTFGLDPQARLDYGYQAVQKLTPMAKALVKDTYGKFPDYSYIGGASNGGRHTMVAAARIPAEYDGYLAHNPGFHLPNTAIAQLYGAQKFASVATDTDDLSTAFTTAERSLVSQAILSKCDALDGLTDGMVFDTDGCQQAFDLHRDVPSCEGDRDGTCLTDKQKDAIAAIFSGAKNSNGDALYAPFVYDPGIAGRSWAGWKFNASVGNRDPLSVAYVFMTPPHTDTTLNTTPALQREFALSFDMDSDAPKIYATTDVYTKSAVDFMYPPHATNLSRMHYLGDKMIVMLGTADPVYSTVDTENWYNALTARNHGDATDFVRYFRVPGMNHSRGGIAADQYDAIGALVNWVEYGEAPDRIVATARGAGNAGGVNRELPSDWSASRTRPLCPYPQIAVYKGSGDSEKAENFVCKTVNH
ncbi:tannase/feruloyl esterase family alpha/beta hydrolase [Vibrio quintilis]|uniref:Tannase and feruloyl esterase n=1 Tax=Vibrio quintilis TaxID=1117707 RepID=A0A1M7YWD3_9VIBR|nr:tannase/feruloyl esterase family alpha/beta hydrolase [Vibrio quintilis]SHO56989.1 Tannase and feruloyl esterase [Vibrio quintilis]